MLSHVPVPPKSLGDYAAVVGIDAVAALRTAAEPWKGARVLNINSTAFGGGVAELLYTEVPLMRDLGLDADWQLIEGHDAFFIATKAMHNGLQGATVDWTDAMRGAHRDANVAHAAGFREEYDFVIVHDPQPVGLLPALLDEGAATKAKWIWRCHIDLTEPFAPVWDYMRPQVEAYHAAVFTMQDFVPADLTTPHLALIPPAIDPLSLKNIPMDIETVHAVCDRYHVDHDRPVAVQVSRFDPWKDPLGVIDAYRLAKEDIPGLQLLLLASMAHDDPEGLQYLAEAEEHSGDDPDIHLLSNLQEVGALAVNAFQREADVIVQKSIREGFGLVVAEGMWKRKPVVAGNVGGIRLQIVDGESGYLVDDVEGCARRMVDVLRDPDRAAAMGAAARDRVRGAFLSTRKVHDFIKLFDALST